MTIAITPTSWLQTLDINYLFEGYLYEILEQQTELSESSLDDIRKIMAEVN